MLHCDLELDSSSLYLLGRSGWLFGIVPLWCHNVRVRVVAA